MWIRPDTMMNGTGLRGGNQSVDFNFEKPCPFGGIILFQHWKANMRKEDVNIVLGETEKLIKSLGYEPKDLELRAPAPIDDFEQNVRISWRCWIDEYIYGDRVVVGTVYELLSNTDILLAVMRSAAFFVGLTTRPEKDFIRRAMFANKFREGDDTLLKTLLKMRIRRWWKSLFFHKWRKDRSFS